jgi:hypothetical protein
MVMQAVEPSRRIEQIMVVVCQWPWGLLAWTRSPRGARPRRRVRLVFAPDSSRKISLAGSKPSWRRRHTRRARAMSGRSCSLARSVFFICQPHLLQRVVDGGQRAFQLRRRAQFLQGQVRLLAQQGPHLALMGPQNHRLAPRTMVARTDLPGPPALLQEFFHHA